MAKGKSKKVNLNQLEAMLDLYLVKKALGLPKNIKEFIVKIAPWLVIIGAVLSFPAILSVLDMVTMLSTAPNGAVVDVAALPSYFLSLVILIAIVMGLLALPGLFARKKAGWTLIFYATLVSAVSSLLSFNLGGLIIGTLLGLYFLFQVREYYK